MNTLASIRKAFRLSERIGCNEAEGLMSPFIDSMASGDEVSRLEAHVSVCVPCQRQLQSYISVKNLLLSAAEPEVPVDLALRSRVRLSRERNTNYLLRLETKFANVVGPIALPAIAGVFFTAVFFTILLGSLGAPEVIAADNSVSDAPLLYQRVSVTGPTMTRFAGNGNGRYLEETLTVETHISDSGRVIHYEIVSGPSNPQIDRWLRDLLYFAEFTPATVFGRPVGSRIILSFVGVTS